MSISKININGVEHELEVPVANVIGLEELFPTPTADDEGKFLSVVGAKAAWVSIVNAEDVQY